MTDSEELEEGYYWVRWHGELKIAKLSRYGEDVSVEFFDKNTMFIGPSFLDKVIEHIDEPEVKDI